MTDVASLGIEVRSTGADKATNELHKLTNAAKVAEQAVAGLSSKRNTAQSALAAARGYQSQSAAALAAARASGTASREDIQAAQAALQKARAVTAAAKADYDAVGASLAAARADQQQASAALKAAQAINQSTVAANDNASKVSASAQRMSGNMSGLSAQFQDIAVSAQMGMSPVQIALQQGTQIAGQMEMAMASGATATGVFAQAFRSLLSPVSLAAIALTAVAAAAIQMVNWSGLAASALNGLADVLQTIAPYAAGAAAGLALLYAPAIIGGTVQLIALLGRLSVAALGLAASFAAANPAVAFVIGITAAVAAANIFREELTDIFGVDIVGAAKTGVNALVGAFVGGYQAVKAVWGMLPAALNDIVYRGANNILQGIEDLINRASDKINEWIAKLPKKLQADWLHVGSVDFGSLDNPDAGASTDLMKTARDAFSGAMNTDYVGQLGEGIAEYAGKGASALKDLAKWIETVDDKTKKKGGGGATEAEKYSDIVDGANRRIASLKAEQAALGMTEEAALKLKYETDLLNEAQQKGIELTAAQRAELAGLAGQMASTELATKRAKEAMDEAKAATKGFLSDLRSGLMNGEGFWKSFGNAAMNVLNKILDKIETELVDALFSLGNTTGGGGGNIFGSILSGIGAIFGFASGGYTGNRAASSVAGVVHGGEYVFSKRATDRIGVGNLEAMHKSAKGYASGGYVAPAPANQNSQNGELRVTFDARSYFDDDGNLQTKIENVSAEQVAKATPKIINAATQRAPAAVAQYKSQKAGGEWR